MTGFTPGTISGFQVTRVCRVLGRNLVALWLKDATLSMYNKPWRCFATVSATPPLGPDNAARWTNHIASICGATKLRHGPHVANIQQFYMATTWQQHARHQA